MDNPQPTKIGIIYVIYVITSPFNKQYIGQIWAVQRSNGSGWLR
jgi:hypothetical protein